MKLRQTLQVIIVKISEFMIPKSNQEDKSINENLLLEGGAYGHMSHPFDDKKLTFADLRIKPPAVSYCPTRGPFLRYSCSAKALLRNKKKMKKKNFIPKEVFMSLSSLLLLHESPH